MEAISVLFLLSTLMVLINVRRKLNNDRTTVQINLSLALLLLHIFNLFHDLALLHKQTCEAIAVLIHFCFLASGNQMFLLFFNKINLIFHFPHYFSCYSHRFDDVTTHLLHTFAHQS